MGSFFGFFMIANQWLTNCQLEDTNDLLEKIRRQGLTPAERKAEDASHERAYTIRAAVALVLLIVVMSGFGIYGAWYNSPDTQRALDAEHLHAEQQVAEEAARWNAAQEADNAAQEDARQWNAAHQDGN